MHKESWYRYWHLLLPLPYSPYHIALRERRKVCVLRGPNSIAVVAV